MCGIAGVISFKEDMRSELGACTKMQNALLRRGPDQKGMFFAPEAALVHTRLAVIDISGGRQPMSVSVGDRRYTIVYNCELYNADELRKELGDADFSTR
jgi:asparagine synthase (glutamine-hydrolysing)